MKLGGDWDSNRGEAGAGAEAEAEAVERADRIGVSRIGKRMTERHALNYFAKFSQNIPTLLCFISPELPHSFPRYFKIISISSDKPNTFQIELLIDDTINKKRVLQRKPKVLLRKSETIKKTVE